MHLNYVVCILGNSEDVVEARYPHVKKATKFETESEGRRRRSCAKRELFSSWIRCLRKIFAQK